MSKQAASGGGSILGRVAGGRLGAHRDWTQGSMVHNLLALGWPVVINVGLNQLGPLVDIIWVGKLGASSVAGVGVAGLVVSLVTVLVMGVQTGTRAMVARFVGAKDYAGANRVVNQSFVFGASLSLVLALVGIFLSSHIVRAFGVAPEVVAQGAAYLRIQFIGTILTTFLTLTSSIMQASGDTMSPMKIAIVARLFHVALSPFLIFGWFMFPRLGVQGAALTSLIAAALGGSLGIWFLLTGRSRLKLDLRDFRIDFRLIWRVLRIGLPASVNVGQLQIVNVVMMRIIAPYGTLAVAAHVIMQRIDIVTLMPGQGFGQATGVLVGQNLGAGKPGRAEKSGWIGAFVVEGFAVLFAAIALFIPERIIGIFASDPELIKIGSTFMRIGALGWFFQGFAMALMEALNGAGDTILQMAAGLGSYWGIQIPLLFVLPKAADMGVYGLRWAMVSALVVRALAYIIYFRMGRWKRKKV